MVSQATYKYISHSTELSFLCRKSCFLCIIIIYIIIIVIAGRGRNGYLVHHLNYQLGIHIVMGIVHWKPLPCKDIPSQARHYAYDMVQ